MDSKVSIVLPTFNGEASVGKSIDSILSQSYKRWELILVNDCSTDDTGAILDRYAMVDKRIKVIHNESNQKLPGSLNTGFRSATGEYLTWTSDDNMYHHCALGRMVNFLDSNPDTDMVYTDMNIIAEDGRFIMNSARGDVDELRFINSVGACFLYRASIAKKVGEYDPDMFLAEDYEYWLRIYLEGKIVHISETLYDYGKTAKSLTATKENEIANQTFLAKDKHREKLLERCKTRAEKNRFYSEMLRLISKKEEKRKVRFRYYLEDAGFILCDIKNRVQSVVNNCKHG